jgi:hypothetical protein
MSSAILTPNFPTHVPPYFCTSHLASGSMVFWCRFGGVLGGEEEDDLEDNDDGVDIMEEECSVVTVKISLTRRPRDEIRGILGPRKPRDIDNQACIILPRIPLRHGHPCRNQEDTPSD